MIRVHLDDTIRDELRALRREPLPPTVCHGPAILPGVIDSKTGKSIIEGKTVTGFTIEGELIFRILDKLRSDGVFPVVEAVTAIRACFTLIDGTRSTTTSTTLRPSCHRNKSAECNGVPQRGP